MFDFSRVVVSILVILLPGGQSPHPLYLFFFVTLSMAVLRSLATALATDTDSVRAAPSLLYVLRSLARRVPMPRQPF